MAEEIKMLNPQTLWGFFYDLTQIPRPTGQMDAVTRYIVDTGKKLGLETVRDEVGNVLIRKNASQGYENKPVVILQSHLDMVPQNNKGIKNGKGDPFDFTRDPIQAQIDGEWVKATGTTLGADNGIGVATTMAILEATDLQHGALEGLFTIDEEVGMVGAYAVRPTLVKGKIMLNLDSETDGEIYIGCAGGADVTARFQYQEETWIPKEDVAVKISLTGMKGGHSGVDIHLGRGNANKLFFRFLKEAAKSCQIRLSSFSGGSARNAIPREAFAVVVVDGKQKYEQLQQAVAAYENLLNEEFAGIENPIHFTAEKISAASLTLIPQDVQNRLIDAVNACVNNVINYFGETHEIVETSTNLAIIDSAKGLTEIKFLVRSASETKKEAVCSSIESTFHLAKADFVETSGSYPGWQPDYNSKVLSVMKQVYEAQRGAQPEVKVMHAGLECGIILSSVPGLDTVSFGPTIQYPHSPDEQVNIASVQKFWDYLTAILKNI